MQRMEYLDEQTPLNLRVTRVGEATVAAQDTMRPMVSDETTLFCVLDGAGALLKRGKEYPCVAGDVCVAMPTEDIRLRAGDATMSVIEVGIAFEGEWPKACAEPVVSCEQAAAILTDMRRIDEMNVGKAAFLTAKVWEWMALVLEQAPAVLITEKADAVDVALNTIHNRYMENLTVSELSAMLGLDRSYFYTVFHKKTGVSPQEYLVGYRLDKAAEWMREHGAKPSAAACAVGYTDLCQFSKMFKRRFGVSPRVYQNSGLSPAEPEAGAPSRIWADEPDVVLL